MDTCKISYRGSTITVTTDVSASWLASRFDIPPSSKVLGVRLPNETEIDLIEKSNASARSLLRDQETVLIVSHPTDFKQTSNSNSSSSTSTSWKEIVVPNSALSQVVFTEIRELASKGADFKVCFSSLAYKNIFKVERCIYNVSDAEMWFYIRREPDYTMGFSISTQSAPKGWIGKPLAVTSFESFVGGIPSDVVGVSSTGGFSFFVHL